MKKRSTQLEAHAMTQKPQTDQGVRISQAFTIANPGTGIKGSSLYFWLEVTEPRSYPLTEWHSFTPASPTYLEAGETKTITLNFDVPPQVAPGVYDYTIAYKFEQDLEQTIRAPLQLEIFSSQPANRFKKKLSFTIDPVTTSEAPYLLQPGKLVVFNIKVKNQTAIADLIYLRCSELPSSWFTVSYPERTAETLGIVQADTGLPLNPQESGEILFMLHPPSNAPAKIYSPTLQLVSMNDPDLVTLDVVYFQVLPDTHLDVELTPAVRSIGREAATFSLKIRNRGNIERLLSIAARDSENLFRVVTDLPNQTVTIAPGQETAIALEATPKRAWQRPLRKPVRSQISVHFASLDPAAEPIPYAPQARLVWRPQPKWVLAALMLIGASSIVLLLSLLYRLNRQPIAQTEILSFAPTQRNYSEGQSNAVRLNWKLLNPKGVNKLVVARLDEGAETETQTYNFSASIPSDLQIKADPNRGCRTIAPSATSQSSAWELPLPNLPWFSSLQQPPNAPALECRGISFAAPKPGAFQYKLKVYAGNSKVPIAEQTTETITVKSTDATQPVPDTSSSPSAITSGTGQPPQIVAFTVNGADALSQPTHTYPLESGESATVVVAWSVQGGDGLEVRLLPFSGAVAPQGSTTYLLSAGIKTITLTARNRAGEQVTQSVDVQAIAPGLRSRPARPPARRATPSTPQSSPSVAPSPEPTSDPGTIPQTPNPDPSSPNNSSPTPDASPSPSSSPSPEVSPSART